jgi:hypothetical protein
MRGGPRGDIRPTVYNQMANQERKGYGACRPALIRWDVGVCLRFEGVRR